MFQDVRALAKGFWVTLRHATQPPLTFRVFVVHFRQRPLLLSLLIVRFRQISLPLRLHKAPLGS